MFKEAMIKSETSIEKMNYSDKKALYLKIKIWFDCDESLFIISTKTLHDYLWSHDPIASEDGVIDFCKSNNLI